MCVCVCVCVCVCARVHGWMGKMQVEIPLADTLPGWCQRTGGECCTLSNEAGDLVALLCF